MKTTFKALILAVAILATSITASLAQDFNKGRKAFDKADYATALSEFRPLAEEGFALAQNNLGYMYYNGKGVIQNFVIAHMWWNIAASNGHENAVYNRDKIAKLMTASQLEKAQELARECVQKNYKGC